MAYLLFNVIIEALCSHSNPLELLMAAIRMSKMGERTLKHRNVRNGCDDIQIKIINCFPLRTSVIPKYINIDTKILVYNFYQGKTEIIT